MDIIDYEIREAFQKKNKLHYLNSVFFSNDIIKREYRDLFKRDKNTIITITQENDSSLAGRKFSETYFCQTPLFIAYKELLSKFEELIPKTRDRNLSYAKLVPIIPLNIANHLILRALINADFNVESTKTINVNISFDSFSVEFSVNHINNEIINNKIEYFNILGIDFLSSKKEYENYKIEHRIVCKEEANIDANKIEILFNKRRMSFKKFANEINNVKLSKNEFDIYDAIHESGGMNISEINNRLGFNSKRLTNYYVSKLKKSNLIKQVGKPKSKLCYYKIKK